VTAPSLKRRCNALSRIDLARRDGTVSDARPIAHAGKPRRSGRGSGHGAGWVRDGAGYAVGKNRRNPPWVRVGPGGPGISLTLPYTPYARNVRDARDVRDA